MTILDYDNVLSDEETMSPGDALALSDNEIDEDFLELEAPGIVDSLETLNDFYEAIKDNDLKTVRRLIREHESIQHLNPKKLNRDYPLNGYKFTSRGGLLTLYNTKSDKERVSLAAQCAERCSSFVHEQQKINDELNALSKECALYEEFKISQQRVNATLIDKYNKFETKIIGLECTIKNILDCINHEIAPAINALIAGTPNMYGTHD